MGFLQQEDLQQLTRYKYVSGAYTYLDNLLNPLYIGLTELFPRWMAPNVITFLGLLFSMSSTAVYLYYKPAFQGDAPAWVSIYGSLCVVLYQSFDFMDGKQARRLGVSGPLGELFDHGCDALNTVFMIVNLMCALNLGAKPLAISTCIICFTFFALAQIIEYKSGVLLSNAGYFGVTEVEFCTAIFHLLPAIFGYDCYSFALPLVSVSFLQFYNVFFTIFAMPAASYLLVQCFKPSNYLPLEERGNIPLSTWEMIKVCLPFFVHTALSVVLFYAPSKTFFADPLVVTLFVGFSFALLTTKIIVCHVAKKQFSWFQPSLGIFCALVAADFLHLPYIRAIYYAALGLQVAAYLAFVSSTIQQITSFLNISCFSIRKKQT